MKAKDLAEILLQNPEAEVVSYHYTGGPTQLLPVNTTLFEEAGSLTSAQDGGEFITNGGLVTQDIVILDFNPNL